MDLAVNVDLVAVDRKQRDPFERHFALFQHFAGCQLVPHQLAQRGRPGAACRCYARLNVLRCKVTLDTSDAVRKLNQRGRLVFKPVILADPDKVFAKPVLVVARALGDVVNRRVFLGIKPLKFLFGLLAGDERKLAVAAIWLLM